MRKVIRTREMGEQFKIGESAYRVEEPTDEMRPCSECDFCDGDNCLARGEVVGFCYKGMRNDNRQAIFKKVTEGRL